MMITRPLLALATLIALALPTAAAAESQSLDHPRQEEPAVEERPRDLPPWLFASASAGRSRIARATTRA